MLNTFNYSKPVCHVKMKGSYDHVCDFQYNQYAQGRLLMLILFNPLYLGNPQMINLANSEDPDEMQYDAAFPQGLHCL